MLSTPTRLMASALACLLLLAGCDVMPARPTAETAPAAEAAFERGDFAAAAQGFLQAAAEHRSQRDAMYLRAAEAWREEGELERAGEILQNISTRRLSPNAAQRLGLLQAEVDLARHQADQALDRLAALEPSLAPSLRPRLLELRARAAQANSNPLQAATALANLGPLLTTAERSGNRTRIRGLLDAMSDADLAFAAASLSAGAVLYPHLARLLTSRGLPLPHPLPQQALGDGTNVAADSDGYRPFQRVALLLPLEGVLSAAASAVRDGFLAAYFQESRSRPQLRIYSSGSTSESARQAWQRAIDEGAQAVVGPLGRDAVMAVFEGDGEGRVPLLALNRSEGAPPPPGSMGFALAPEDEGIAIANRIVDQGGKRVIVIDAGDDYGQRVSAALTARLQQRDAHVVATTNLPSNSPMYGQAIAAALQQAGARTVIREEGDLQTEENRLVIEADAIFFSGRADQARLLAPQLRLAGIYDLPLYASSQITAGSGNVRMDKELDGFEFPESPWLLRDSLSGFPTRSATQELDSARGGGARLFAFGMDAFLLLGHFRQLLDDPQAVLSGATGQLRFDGFGNVLRTPSWARFQGGRIQAAREGGLIGDQIQFREP